MDWGNKKNFKKVTQTLFTCKKTRINCHKRASESCSQRVNKWRDSLFTRLASRGQRSDGRRSRAASSASSALRNDKATPPRFIPLDSNSAKPESGASAKTDDRSVTRTTGALVPANILKTSSRLLDGFYGLQRFSNGRRRRASYSNLATGSIWEDIPSDTQNELQASILDDSRFSYWKTNPLEYEKLYFRPDACGRSKGIQ